MAKKTRKQKQRSAARRQPPVIPGGAGLSTVGTAEPLQPESDGMTEAAAPIAIPGPAAAIPAGGRRRVERLTTPAITAPMRPGRAPSSAASMFAPLEPDDAAIPFDRVPYVPADLRRVAIMAAVMVVVIIIAAVVVSHIVK